MHPGQIRGKITLVFEHKEVRDAGAKYSGCDRAEEDRGQCRTADGRDDSADNGLYLDRVMQAGHSACLRGCRKT